MLAAWNTFNPLSRLMCLPFEALLIQLCLLSVSSPELTKKIVIAQLVAQ